MANLTQKQLSELYMVQKQTVSKAVKEKRLIANGRFIDDTLDKNRALIQKWASKKGIEIGSQEQAKEINKLKSGESYTSLDKQKKSLEVNKLTEEVEILKVKKDKLHGVLIPTELVKSVFVHHTASISTSFRNMAENWLSEIAKSSSMNSQQVAYAKGRLTKIINIAVDDAIKASKKDIANIINEYSEKKGVGERD